MTQQSTQQSHETTESTHASLQLKGNIYETAGGEAYVIEIPVPGLNSDEITIEVTIDTVTVAAKPQQTEAESGRTYIQHEQLVQPMSRIFEFPEEIDTDNVRSTLERGVLKIEVPKAAAGRPKVVQPGQKTSSASSQTSNP
jgi:HSP20 family protein